MVQESGEGKDQIKLIDFGLAKVIESQTSNSTAMPVVAGSFGYMSPEQLSAKPLTPSSDVYSLAVIAHEMITGSRPFVPTSVFELYHLQQKGFTRKASRKDLPEVAEIVLAKALSFQPELRHQSAREFTEQLAGALQGKILTLPYTVPVVFPHSDEKKSWRQSLPWLASILLIVGFGFALKTWMFLFSDWSTFLTDRITFFILVPLVMLLLLFNKVYSQRTGIWIAASAVGIFLLANKLLLPPVISITSIPGHEVSSKDFFLNYSDPKGYKYTIADRTFLIALNPGGWNEIHDYSVEITLSPEIEFADLYLDKQFNFSQQLMLKPSPTNDIIRFEKTGDHFNTKREIAFTSKFRREPKSKVVLVKLKTSRAEFSYEKNNP
jgi:serine/threonine protein kinase